MKNLLTRWLSLIAVVAISMIFGAMQLHVIDQKMSPAKSDLQAVQIGTRAVLLRVDPFSAETTRDIQIAYYGRALRPSDHVNTMGFVYPVFAAFVLAPLAALTFAQARMIFLIVVPVLSVLASFAWVEITGVRLNRYAVASLLLVSWPFLWALRLQQMTLVAFILLAFGIYLLHKQRPVPAGIVLALTLFKPQLVILLILWLLLWATLRRRWSFVLSFLGAATALVAASFLAQPGWVVEWRHAGAELLRYTDQHPALVSIFGDLAGRILTVAVLAVSGYALWRLRRSNSIALAVGIALAATLAVMPTDAPMIYNQVLLLPAALVLVGGKPERSLLDNLALCFLGWTFVSVPVAVLVSAQLLPFVNVLLPVALTVGLVARVPGIAPKWARSGREVAAIAQIDAR